MATKLKAKAQKLVDDQKKLNAKFPKVKSFDDLFSRSNEGDLQYQKLCCAALENLGGKAFGYKQWKLAYGGLQDYLMSMIGEYGESELDAEQSILDEINFVRECIDQIKP